MIAEKLREQISTVQLSIKIKDRATEYLPTQTLNYKSLLLDNLDQCDTKFNLFSVKFAFF